MFRTYEWAGMWAERFSLSCNCSMIKWTTFLECVSFDSESFPLIFWDSDFCLRMRKRGYENIYTSFARGKWQRIEPEKVLDAQAE